MTADINKYVRRYYIKFIEIFEWNRTIANLIPFFLIFFFSWFIAFLCDPRAEMVRAENFYYFYFVVASTIGFGDIVPISFGTRLVTICIFLLNSGYIIFLINQAVSFFLKVKKLFKMGGFQVELENHAVIIVGDKKRALKILSKLKPLIEKKKIRFLVCSTPDLLSEDDLPHFVRFAGGEIFSQEILNQANIAMASKVIIDPDNDLGVTDICVMINYVNPRAHVVVALKDKDKFEGRINYINPNYEVIPAGNTEMIVRSFSTPGTSYIFNRLLPGSKRIVYQIEKNIKFGKLLENFKINYNATIVGVSETSSISSKIIENPPLDFVVKKGMCLYYIGDERVPKTLLKDDKAIPLGEHTVYIGSDTKRSLAILKVLNPIITKKEIEFDICTSTEIPGKEDFSPLVKFIEGDIFSQEILDRANIKKASKIIIDSGIDLGVADICVIINYINPNAHVVVALNDKDVFAERIKSINPNYEIIPSGNFIMIIQAFFTPGTSYVFDRLLPRSKRIVYQKEKNMKFKTLWDYFKKKYNATIVGVSETSAISSKIIKNPQLDYVVKKQMCLYYIGDEKIPPELLIDAQSAI